MKCKVCGNELFPGDTYCISCGTPADTLQSVEYSQPVDNSQIDEYSQLDEYSQPVRKQGINKKIAIIIASCVAAVVLIIAIIAVIASVAGKTEDETPVFEQEATTEAENQTVTEQTTTGIVADVETTTAEQYNGMGYVSSDTPGDAGIVVRAESTYYSDQLAILFEGAPVRIVSDADNGTEYIQISFDNNGTEVYGWALRKYIVYGKQYGYSVPFEQQEVNLYVSNITETGISDFLEKPSDDEILKFVMNHAILNYNPSVSGLEYGNFKVNGKHCNVRVDAAYINKLSSRFFGTGINVDNIKNENISSGYLYGKSIEVSSQGLAVVSGVYCDPSFGEYRINFAIYKSGSDNESAYYSYSPAQAKADKSLKYSSDGYVILQKYSDAGQDAYKVIEYKTNLSPSTEEPTKTIEKITENKVVPNFNYDSQDQYLFDSANKYITNEYLQGCTRDEITVILNEIYARHGYIFKDAELREYFNSQSWYHGTVQTLEEAAEEFNSIEQKNVDTIYLYQKSMGWRS